MERKKARAGNHRRSHIRLNNNRNFVQFHKLSAASRAAHEMTFRIEQNKNFV